MAQRHLLLLYESFGSGHGSDAGFRRWLDGACDVCPFSMCCDTLEPILTTSAVFVSLAVWLQDATISTHS